ncbi:hypothetical protein NVP1111B_04 [Vibrio phage 1.111.B._10N.286.45.E6]|nr:hypothetical protein NVP1111A_04 [Vibrio phage 1.111.A._10N.286.45.E6]AUR88260.1 hypothetical protein NVP1111B_04 [Vibrio phage 1.111.B._10N.286.45.E6]
MCVSGFGCSRFKSYGCFVMSKELKVSEIKAAQIEHLKGLITFSEFMEIVGSVCHGTFGSSKD